MDVDVVAEWAGDAGEETIVVSTALNDRICVLKIPVVERSRNDYLPISFKNSPFFLLDTIT